MMNASNQRTVGPASCGPGRGANTILDNFLRDVKLVKAQIGDDNKDVRFLKVHQSNISLKGFLAGVKEAFPEKTASLNSSCVIQFRDKVGDFVTLRSDVELEALQLHTFLDETVIKFVLQGNITHHPVTNSDSNSTDRKISTDGLPPVVTDGVPVLPGEMKRLIFKMSSTENTLNQLSKNFGEFRRAVTNDLASIITKLDKINDAKKNTVQPIKNTNGVSLSCAEMEAFDTVLPQLPPIQQPMLSIFADSNIPRYPSPTLINERSGCDAYSSSTNPYTSTLETPGALYAQFISSFFVGDPVKITLTGPKPSDKLHLLAQVYTEAKEAGDRAQPASNQLLRFSETILTTSAKQVCNASLGLVLSDLQQSSGKDAVQAFCTSSGNMILKILFCWGYARWNPVGFSKSAYSKTMNSWLRSHANGAKNYMPKQVKM